MKTFNYKFGIIAEDIFRFAPYMLKSEDTTIITNREDIYNDFGYKRIEYTEPPSQEGYEAIQKFTDQGEYILEEWDLEPIPEEATEEDYQDALRELGVSL